MIIDINAKYAAADAEDNASRKKMIYTSDSGILYVVTIDENIGESMGFDDFTNADSAREKPSSLRMRTISYKDSSGKVAGQMPVGKPTFGIYTEGGTITMARKGKLTGLVVTVIGAQGEKRTLLSAADTGQQSGDNS